MMRPAAAIAFTAALSLSACASQEAHNTVSNDVLAAEQTLTATERLALIYTTLPRCGGVARVCSDHATVQKIKDLDNQAYMAVKAARQNAGLLSAALAAIGAFQKAVPMTPGG